MSLISTQQSLLIFKDNQTERLSAELKRVEQGKQPYYIAVVAKTAIKLIEFADKAGLSIAKILEEALEETQANQQWEMNPAKDAGSEMRLREAQRGVQACITAAGYMQNIHSQIAGRATENLCQAHLLIVGADGNRNLPTYLPPSDQIRTNLTALRDLTMSYLHDMAEYGEQIAKYDGRNDGDGFEISTKKEALRMIQAFANEIAESAISLVELAYGSVSSVDTIGDAKRKEHSEWLSAYGVAGASMAKFAADLLYDAMSSLGTVTVITRTTRNTITESDLYGDITTLTGTNRNFRLN